MVADEWIVLNGARRLTIRALIVAAALMISASSFADEPGICLVQAARDQIGVTTLYDPAYRRLPYPNGDVPRERGVCTDVVVRTYRAFGIDLQRLVHEDMKGAWPKYPKLWGLTRPDTNIDHRRVPNLATYFARHGQKLSTTSDPSIYKPGDLVTWRLNSGVPHIGIVADGYAPSGVPLVIHNIGAGTREEDILFSFEITGHYPFIPQTPIRCREEVGAGASAE